MAVRRQAWACQNTGCSRCSVKRMSCRPSSKWRAVKFCMLLPMPCQRVYQKMPQRCAEQALEVFQIPQANRSSHAPSPGLVISRVNAAQAKMPENGVVAAPRKCVFPAKGAGSGGLLARAMPRKAINGRKVANEWAMRLSAVCVFMFPVLDRGLRPQHYSPPWLMR